jgi:hypothetical protein
MVQPSEWIDGKFLVLTDRSALPPRCVRTNRPVSERECQTWDLPWLPLPLKIVMCVAPVFLLFAPYAVRQRCRVQAGISKSVRFRYLLRKLLACLLILGSLIAPVVCLAYGWTVTALVTVLCFPFLFWGGFILLILFTSPLTIAEHKGDHFWLKGCSPEFLASLNASLGEAAPTPVS